MRHSERMVAGLALAVVPVVLLIGLSAVPTQASEQAATAIVSTEVLSGDPMVPGATFAVGLRLTGNTDGPVGTYAFRLSVEPQMAEVVEIVDGGDGFGQPPEVSKTSPFQCVFTGVAAASTLENGLLCVLTLQTVDAAAIDPYSLEIAGIPPDDIVTMKSQPDGDKAFIRLAYAWNTGETQMMGQAARPETGDTFLTVQPITSGPYQAGDLFVVALELTGNADEDLVGTYAFEVRFSQETLEYSEVQPAAFSAQPTVNYDNGVVRISAFDANSTLTNGRLFVIGFRVREGAQQATVTAHPFGATPLVGMNYRPIEHTLIQGAQDIPLGME